ncbi:hypothetical protein BC628DRAFT_596960 [Trametes gibbosa]|nr:hypothetical protein BC628DRAFT_596960 [Trametes gibbosa]
MYTPARIDALVRRRRADFVEPVGAQGRKTNSTRRRRAAPFWAARSPAPSRPCWDCSGPPTRRRVMGCAVVVQRESRRTHTLGLENARPRAEESACAWGRSECTSLPACARTSLAGPHPRWPPRVLNSPLESASPVELASPPSSFLEWGWGGARAGFRHAGATPVPARRGTESRI